MWQCILVFALCLIGSGNVSSASSLAGRLFGIDSTGLNPAFVQINRNSSNFTTLLDLGRSTFPGPACATKSMDNREYLVAYIVYDSRGVPHYYFLTVDVADTPQIKLNQSLIDKRGSGSFWQIADDENRIIGIRESNHPGATLEVAAINRTTGDTATVGYYPYGEYSLVMAFARRRRLFYNIIESLLFCGVNVDTGAMDVSIQIPDYYSIYAMIYDAAEDRLLSIVYCDQVVKNAWFLAEIIIDPQASSMSFTRLGQSVIPMQDPYLWSTTYTLALKERQWLTLWADKRTDNKVLISFDIDSGTILEQTPIDRSRSLSNVVYFE